MVARWDLVPAWVGEYIGIPYVCGGREKTGADCWGLFSMVHQRKGIELPDYNGPDWTKNRSEQRELGLAAMNYAKLFQEVQRGEEQLFDGILIRMVGVPMHLAMVVAPGVMLHTEDGADSCIASYLDGIMWRNRIIGFYRHTG